MELTDAERAALSPGARYAYDRQNLFATSYLGAPAWVIKMIGGWVLPPAVGDVALESILDRLTTIYMGDPYDYSGIA